MKIFRDKDFKYEMQSIDAYQKCILSCEINHVVVHGKELKKIVKLNALINT